MKIIQYENVRLDDFEFDCGSIMYLKIACDVIVEENGVTYKIPITSSSNSHYDCCVNNYGQKDELFALLEQLDFYYNVVSDLLSTLTPINVVEKTDNSSFKVLDFEIYSDHPKFYCSFRSCGEIGLLVETRGLVKLQINNNTEERELIFKGGDGYNGWTIHFPEDTDIKEYMHHAIESTFNFIHKRKDKDIKPLEIFNMYKIPIKTLKLKDLRKKLDYLRDDFTDAEVVDFYRSCIKAIPPEMFRKGIYGCHVGKYDHLLNDYEKPE